MKQERIASKSATVHTLRAINLEYAAAGYMPVMCGDLILSPSLLKALGKWPPQNKSEAILASRRSPPVAWEGA